MLSNFSPEKPAAFTQGEETLVIHYVNESSVSPIGGGLSVLQQSSRYTEDGIVEYDGGAGEMPPLTCKHFFN